MSEKLWGNEVPIDLNELTLNMVPDDSMDKKKVSKYAWNEKKNKFVTGQTDSKGNLLKKNEAGVRVKVDDKKPSSFKKWLSRNKNNL